MIPLSKERRREVCVHEAGHAVIGAMAGDFADRVAVAPEGCLEWVCKTRRGVHTDLWGVCESSDPFAFQFLRWDADEMTYFVDHAHLTALRNAIPERSHTFLPTVRKHARGEICGLMAGPAAEQIFKGEEIRLHDEWLGGWSGPGGDITKAMGIGRLLYWRNEYDYLAELTAETLRRADVWSIVLRFADELERKGEMEEELDVFLPDPIPNWPPSSRAKVTKQDRA